MPKRLTSAQVDQYARDGFTGPIPVLSTAEARSLRDELEAYERSTGKVIGFPEKSKSYLLFGWADAIVHHPKVLDAVEDVIGPDILVYHTTLWVKEPHVEMFTLWHQDDAYFFLDPAEQVTAWVALSDASVLAGCMRMIPGSHKEGFVEHTDSPSRGNIIRRGRAIHDRFADTDGTLVPLRAGEMSLHNTHTIHSSGANDSDDRRIGLGVSYIPTRVRSRTEARSSALLVRGVDEYRHFHAEKRLQKPLSEEARAAHALAYDFYMKSARIPEGG
ncbi:MAG: phytanoyl-CoA dioxygenase family protein [Proteobacteria bacterium]|nr:phytanoyl-CoA dioxygenase family protein [Pseudomonadota bacterium]